MPEFPRAVRSAGRIFYLWGPVDVAGRHNINWYNEIAAGEHFRLLPGETLPVWPSPFPMTGAPRGASLVRPLDDGRIALYGANAPSSVLDWYDERGHARPRPRSGPVPYDYVAYSESGAPEVLVRTPLPEGAGITGGADISSSGAVFAQVINRYTQPSESHILRVFEHGALSFELPVADIVSTAQRISVAADETPLMPAVVEPHRIAVDPLP